MTANEMESARSVNDIRKHARDDVATTLARPRLPNRVLLSFGESGTLPTGPPSLLATSLSDACALFLLLSPAYRSVAFVPYRVINVPFLVFSRNNVVCSYDRLLRSNTLAPHRFLRLFQQVHKLLTFGTVTLHFMMF